MPSGVKNIAEYFSSLARFRRDGVRDERLDRCFEMAETRLQAMGAGSLGGFAIPSQFSTDLRFVEPDQAVVRPRATVIQAGSPPDSEYSLPTLDQTGSGNLLGGVVLAHLGEGVEMVETAAHLREVTMQPKEISAYIVCTNQVLTNWESSGAIVGGLLKRAMIICEDADFLFGDGVNKSIGLVNCGASIAYNRAGAKSISYPDVYGMFAKLLQRGGSPVWCGSPTIIPQLAAMVDSGGHSVWVGGEGKLAGSVANALPNSLFGVPLLFNDRLPVLGNKGDLMLLNPWYYLIKDGSLYAASSDQVLFTSNKTIFKIVFHVDGKPWMSAPLPLEGGGAGDVISPFVILD
ncbi:MAG: phage major capsid protein [Syntrophorhabdales bacterium]